MGLVSSQVKAARREPGVTGKNEPSVTRIYYMRFAGPNNDALVVGGRPQPAYTSVASRS